MLENEPQSALRGDGGVPTDLQRGTPLTSGDAGGWGLVVVLNWNRWRDTIRCLSSLDHLDHPNYRVLVIDNGSRDGSVEQIRLARPDVTLLESDRNLGFAGGNNLGIRYALDHGAEYVWVLNNDTVVEPAALRRALAAMVQDPSLGIVGSTHVTSAEPWQASAPYATAVHLQGRAERGFVCVEHAACDGVPPHRVDVVRGTMLLRSRMLREIGLLETRYFHYYEEIDLSLRARAAGWHTGYACSSRIWHAIGASLSTRSPQALYYHVRNRQLVRRKLWHDRPGETLLREPDFTRWLAENVLRSFLRGRWTLTRALLFGLADGLRGRGGMRDVAPGH